LSVESPLFSLKTFFTAPTLNEDRSPERGQKSPSGLMP